MKARETQWFIEPDVPSNKAIADFLSGSCLQYENCDEGIFDDKGMPHNVWQMPDYPAVRLLLSGRKYFGFKFKIFNRQNNRGPVREWLFADKKKHKKVVF